MTGSTQEEETTMNVTKKITAFALLTTLGTAALTPSALADSSKQSDKNNMRNLGIAGAAIAGYGLLNHNSTATLLGAAAGGYGAYKYEQDRKAQSADQRSRDRHYYYHHNSTRNGRKYYSYDGQRYYKDLSTGARHRVD
jgi:hypothetical protein